MYKVGQQLALITGAENPNFQQNELVNFGLIV
jgi:hypothetical protein